MRALITAAANMTGRIVAAIIGGFMTVVTIGAVVMAGIVVTAGPTNELQGLTKRMKKVTPLFDTKIRLNCYFLPIN